MSDNTVAAAVLETAAAATIKPESEACYSCIALQIENSTLNAENKALEANYATLWIAYQMLAESAKEGLDAYYALDEYGDNFGADEIGALKNSVESARLDVNYALAGEILELPAVDEEDEAAAAAEDEAKKRAEASAEAAVGVSWGDETQVFPETHRSAPLPAAPVAAAPRSVLVVKPASAPLPAAKRKPSGVKPNIKANRPWLFCPKPLLPWLKAEMEKSPKEDIKCTYGRNCTNPSCKFEHFCSYAAYKKSGKTVYQLECKKNPEACSHVHHICDCQNKGCKAVHLDRIPGALAHLYYEPTA
jgi:hypothetical protein